MAGGYSLTLRQLPGWICRSMVTDALRRRQDVTHICFANSHLLLRTIVICATVALRSGIVLTTAIAVG